MHFGRTVHANRTCAIRDMDVGSCKQGEVPLGVLHHRQNIEGPSKPTHHGLCLHCTAHCASNTKSELLHVRRYFFCPFAHRSERHALLPSSSILTRQDLPLPHDLQSTHPCVVSDFRPALHSTTPADSEATPTPINPC